MELKTVGKIGMVKRKQFLQKRDISRSHEVNSIVMNNPTMILLLLIKMKLFVY